jgi:hypothetical protein
MAKDFIKKATKNKGGFHRSLGIPEGQTIPASLRNKIADAQVGDVIKNPTSKGKASIKVTGNIKKEASLAKTLGKLHK